MAEYTGSWTKVAEVADFESSERKLVDLGGEHQVVLFKVEDQYYGVSSWCSHQKMSLSEGPLEGYELMCPLHGARFDIRDGKQLCFPAVKPIATYPIKVENERIYLQL